MKNMTISRLAKSCDVGVETVRYYQRRGLLAVPDRGAGWGTPTVRRYGEEDVRRLRFIRAAQSAGFTLTEIAELLGLERTDDRARARELAQQRILAIDAKIRELKLARNALMQLEKSCASGPYGPCPILDAFDVDGHFTR